MEMIQSKYPNVDFPLKKLKYYKPNFIFFRQRDLEVAPAGSDVTRATPRGRSA
ncbi:hypothetical protein YC2023_075613 [Brassica napus]